MTEIIVIGAGASGLIAARELTNAGKKVTVLEARARLGGRIFTQNNTEFSFPVEAGAEFIHGDLPLTQGLLKQAQVPLHLMKGKNYQVLNGVLQESKSFIEDFEVLLDRLNQLEQDLPFAEFLDRYLPEDQFANLRQGVIRFAEGYDAADIHKASTFALREEWQTDAAANSYHPVGGYYQIIELLAQEIRNNGGTIIASSPVKEIKWQPGMVQVTCTGGTTYTAQKVLITVPLGVLQADPGSEGYIAFSPEIPARREALTVLGFGPIIKILLEFKTAFWEEAADEPVELQKMPELAFLFTDSSAISAWWTQLPNKIPLLTGWIAGTEAEKRRTTSNDEIMAEALQTLAFLFKTNVEFLKKQLIVQKVYNWLADPFARGAYAYATVNGTAARQALNEPEADTLFFAGEALYEGPAMGTV
ncbi:MAG: FAD-dependent oxidoreductase, partial [Bacteroidota bacterium]|nr:FAD-dependent oxidoreductase [Bacteroidota bacterium]